MVLTRSNTPVAHVSGPLSAKMGFSTCSLNSDPFLKMKPAATVSHIRYSMDNKKNLYKHSCQSCAAFEFTSICKHTSSSVSAVSHLCMKWRFNGLSGIRTVRLMHFNSSIAGSGLISKCLIICRGEK